MTSAARMAFERAIAHETKGEDDKALAAYLSALELAPEDTEIAYRTAVSLLRSGFLDEAVSQLRRIVFADPEHVSARASLGNCQLLMEDYETAETNFLEVLKAAPDNRNALYGLASVYLKTGRAQDAEKPAAHLVEIMPGSAPALSLYAASKAHDPQASAAVAAFRKALQIDPDYRPALLGLSHVLKRRQRIDEAIDLADRAIALKPKEMDGLLARGDALQTAGRLEEARQDFVEALNLDEKNNELKVRISVISRKLGEHGIALAFANDAYDDNPAAIGAGNALGAALAALSRPKDAQAVLTSVAANKPLPEDLRQRIGDLIVKLTGERDSPDNANDLAAST
ncbi:tetratricopeptide repeat protein [Roseibium hamelinense]|uniref:Tetratricopeptide repeat protein n=1 Tax=Roseibium hamelinense TaxID=150831 RepID=A0A562THE8_9HYPH|nr:tetratricopeptide repeat protein [Roseibium hamelinense]MTI45772.1 tetratricopeptide repeat protein [Roseibium hamelinense]TWI93045.1 tetratricopeptide repeat protein [Roseibium hamelinense]